MTIFVVVLLAIGVRALLIREQQISTLATLSSLETNNEEPEPYILGYLDDSLGRCGFTNRRIRAKIVKVRLLFLVLLPLACLLLSLFSYSWEVAIKLFAAVTLFVLLGWQLIIHSLQRRYLQRSLFAAPLLAETLLLLVSSGLGLIPSLARAIDLNKGTPCPPLIAVYQLTSKGLPFSRAITSVLEHVQQPVIRHILMHLEIALSDGGEIGPALRSLSDYAHTEWKLSVERRIKRLEQFVIFPVFISVIGLVLLVAAVPLVPILKFKESLKLKPPLKTEELYGQLR